MNYVNVVNRSQLASNRIVAENQPDGATRIFGSLMAISSGLDTSMFNEIYVYQEPAEAALIAAREWMDGRDVPFSVIVADTVLDSTQELLTDLGFQHEGSEPGMVLQSLDEIPANESVADVFKATDAGELDDVAATFSAVFGVPRNVSVQLFRPYEPVEGIVWRSLLADVNGTPAGCGICVKAGDIVGVYGIGVREEYRRQGIGEALTWEVLRAGSKMEGRMGMLFSTEMGYPLYEKMGFETVVTHHEFTKSS